MRWLKQRIDLWAIRAAARTLPNRAVRRGQAAEVEQWMRSPSLFVPEERAAEVRVAGDGSFQFVSGFKTGMARNDVAQGRLFRAGANWEKRPAVVLVHGWNAELHYRWVLPGLARALAAAGLNGVLLELPYHLHRRPPRSAPVSDFISEEIPRMLEATAQAIGDINGLVHWLKRCGCPGVGIWGFSLGAWLAGLHACVSGAEDASLLTTPVCQLERAVLELEFCHPIRRALEVVPVDFSPLNLDTRQPKVAPEAIRLVQAEHDLFVPAESYQVLARSWGLKDWQIEPQSHITILLSRRANRAGIEWLASRLQPQE
jgi:dienelactone hydrolase